MLEWMLKTGKVEGIYPRNLSTAKGAAARREIIAIYRRATSLCYGQLVRIRPSGMTLILMGDWCSEG